MKKTMAVVLVAGAMACGGGKESVKPQPLAAAVDACPGRPVWTCTGGSGPCVLPEYAGRLCAVGMASNLSESLGLSTAGAAARGELAKFLEAQLETFNNQIQAARTQADAAEEIQKVQAGVKQITSRNLAGVATPRRHYDPATRTTWVLAIMDPEGFAQAMKGLTQATKLSEDARKRIDTDAQEVENAWKGAKQDRAR